jgi:hypothetical protein
LTLYLIRTAGPDPSWLATPAPDYSWCHRKLARRFTRAEALLAAVQTEAEIHRRGHPGVRLLIVPATGGMPITR